MREERAARSTQLFIAIIGVVSALLGTGIGVLASYSTTRLTIDSQRSQETEKFMREQRRSAYADFIDAIDATEASFAAFDNSRDNQPTDAPEAPYPADIISAMDKASDRISQPYSQIILLAPRRISQLATLLKEHYAHNMFIRHALQRELLKDPDKRNLGNLQYQEGLLMPTSDAVRIKDPESRSFGPEYSTDIRDKLVAAMRENLGAV